MGRFFEFYQEGGMFMHFVLLANVFTGALLLAQLALGKRPLLPVVGAGIGGNLCVGLLGTALGLENVFRAVAMAAGDQKVTLMVVGAGEALGPLRLALWLAIPLCIGLGLAFTLQSLREQRAA